MPRSDEPIAIVPMDGLGVSPALSQISELNFQFDEIKLETSEEGLISSARKYEIKISLDDTEVLSGVESGGWDNSVRWSACRCPCNGSKIYFRVGMTQAAALGKLVASFGATAASFLAYQCSDPLEGSEVDYRCLTLNSNPGRLSLFVRFRIFRGGIQLPSSSLDVIRDGLRLCPEFSKQVEDIVGCLGTIGPFSKPLGGLVPVLGKEFEAANEVFTVILAQHLERKEPRVGELGLITSELRQVLGSVIEPIQILEMGELQQAGLKRALDELSKVVLDCGLFIRDFTSSSTFEHFLLSDVFTQANMHIRQLLGRIEESRKNLHEAVPSSSEGKGSLLHGRPVGQGVSARRRASLTGREQRTRSGSL